MRQVGGFLLFAAASISCGSNAVTTPKKPIAAVEAQTCGIERSRREPSLITFSAVEAKACAIACDKGDAGSCVTLGLAHENGRGVSRDAEKAFQRYHQGCEKKYVPACSHEAGMYLLGGGTDLDPSRAITMARRTCDQGDPIGCLVMGRASYDGLGMPKDVVHAGVLFRRVCDAGEMTGCAQLAVLYANGEGVMSDAATSRELAQRACDARHATGCLVLAELGLMHAAEAQGEAGIETSLQRLEGACRDAEAQACLELGQILARTDIVPQNIPLAAEWLAQAEHAGHREARPALRALGKIARDHLRDRCMHDNAVACGSSSGWFMSEGTSESALTAAKLAERGCVQLKDHTACALLAWHHMRGAEWPKDLEKAKKLAKEACDEGAEDGCLLLAQAIDEGVLLKSPDLETSFRYGQRACRLGLISSCTAAGRIYTFGTGAELNRSLGFRLLDQACNAGAGDACNVLAEYYFNGWEPVKQDAVRGRQLLEQACTQGEAPACLNVGIRHLNGDRVLQDDRKGFQFVNKACAGGMDSACRLVKIFAAMGWGTERDTAHGEENLRSFCKEGDAQVCGVLGELLIVKDETSVEAMDLLEKSCATNVVRACGVLGQIYVRGIGRSPDPKKAISHLSRACTMGEPHACSFLGTLYFQGQGVPASDALSSSFQKQACELGSMRGCAALAELHEKGRGVERNDAKAVELYEKACAGDYGPACRRLGEMLLEGKGVPRRDPSRAADKLEDACRLGDTEAVNKLLELRTDGWVAPRRLENTLNEACAKDTMPACRSLAALWWAPPIRSLIERRPADALARAEKACVVNDLPACGIAAGIYAAGPQAIPQRDLDIDKATRKPTRIVPAQIAIPRNDQLALERYKKACGERVSISFSAASIGLGPKPESRSSVAPVASLEQQNDPASCYEWAKRDKQRAPELLERACRGGTGDQRACTELKKTATK